MKNYDNPVSLEIYLPSLYDFNKMDDNTKTMWEQHVSGIAGVGISLNYLELKAIDAQLDELETDRLVFIDNIRTLNELRANDLIIPLNQYIQTINGASIIDKEAYEDFTDENGNTWVLPSFTQRTQYGYRNYNRGWLEKLNIDVPDTLEEFTEYLRLVRSVDLDDDDRMQYAIRISDYYSLMELFDIFLSFGCRPSVCGITNLSYNPETNEYEDIVLSSEFRQAMEYMKYLLDEDLIINTEEMTTEEQEAKYNVGGTSPYDTIPGNYLEGDSKSNLIWESTYTTGFAVMKDCLDVEEKLSYLINTVFFEEDLLEAFNYGIKGYHFDETDEYYYRVTVENGTARYFQNININIVKDLSKMKPFYSTKMTYEENKEFYDMVNEERNKYFGELDALRNNDSEKFYHYDMTKEITVGNEGSVSRKIFDAFEKLLRDVFKEGKSVEDAINDYITKYFNDGFEDFINELNDQ
ncbi:MAG: hypothetical protein JXQ23_13275 [Clostridia bacterium]|nr:hypothetical protein [Clostridia bacterium]